MKQNFLIMVQCESCDLLSRRCDFLRKVFKLFKKWQELGKMIKNALKKGKKDQNIFCPATKSDDTISSK